jgi:hypothetical protein
MPPSSMRTYDAKTNALFESSRATDVARPQSKLMLRWASITLRMGALVVENMPKVIGRFIRANPQPLIWRGRG